MNKLIQVLKSLLIVLLIPGSLFIILLLVSTSSLGMNTLGELLRQAIAAAILSWGVIFCVKIDIWNFSVGACVIFSAIIGGNIALRLNAGLVLTIALITLTGVLIGLITGCLFILLRIPSVVLTIGIMFIMESATAVAFGGGGVVLLNDILKMSLFPYDMIVGLILFALAFVLMHLTNFGYNLRAIGSNIAVAKQNGINIDMTRIICFAVTGFFCGCFAFMSLAKSGIITPRVSMGSMSLVFDSLICAFIAIALEKYINLMVGVFIGSLSVQMIKICILAIGFQSVFQQAIIAIFLLIFMTFNAKSDMLDSVKRTFKKTFQTKVTQKEDLT